MIQSSALMAAFFRRRATKRPMTHKVATVGKHRPTPTTDLACSLSRGNGGGQGIFDSIAILVKRVGIC